VTLAEGSNVWVVCHHVGEWSEAWLWRQLTGMRRLRPHVVTWEYKNREHYPLGGIDADVLAFTAQPTGGPGRWGVRAANLLSCNWYGSFGAELSELRRIAARSKPAAIIAHFGHMALRVLPLSASLGIPLVAHFHGMDLTSMLRNRWYLASLKRSIPRFAGMIAVGSPQRAWLLEHGAAPERVHVIPCGTPTDSFGMVERPARTQGVRFVAVSRLVDWKGVDITLRAFSQIAERFDATLDIAGDGPERAALELLAAELRIGQRVIFHGRTPNERVKALLDAGDVFVQHSITLPSGSAEGFGVSITEAAATGLPVVVTRSGGIPDQVIDGETGYLVEERDARGMSERMASLAADPALRTAMGAAGRRRAVECFDTCGQIRKLEDVVLAAIRRAAGGGGR
jgi:colanic acid/amylovoran biosynthesis glycosyltransferase